MRNLKRALSLALASVMLLGMIVVGTSAASYPDVDSNDNVEAIEVLNAVGAMAGDNNGNFNPDNTVTRNELAVITARLLLGEGAKDYVGITVGTFTDVPDWADKYVAACYDNGIVNGIGGGLYDGDRAVTTQEAAAIMLRALGYENLNASSANWAQPVVAKANEIRLFKDVGSNPTATLTRNQIAQLGLNTLKADVVTTTGGTTVDLGEIGSVTTSVEYKKVEAKDTSKSGTDPEYNNTGDGIQQLCEKLYGDKLKLATVTSSDNDAFDRKADYKWTWDGKTDVYTAATSATVIFTAKTSDDDVLKAIKGYEAGSTEIKTKTTTTDEDITVAGAADIDDGDVVVTKIAGLTENGKQVEIFVKDNKIDNIVVVAYTVATVDTISEGSDGMNYTLKNDSANVTGVIYNEDKDEADTIVLNGDIAEDDVVTYATGTNSDGNPVYYVYPTTSFTGTQSSYNNGKKTIVVSGETYTVGTGVSDGAGAVVMGDFANGSKESNYYVDQYGYMGKTTAVAEDTNYAVVDKIVAKETTGELKASKTVTAQLFLADGSTVTANVVEINGLAVKDKLTTADSNIGFTIDATPAYDGFKMSTTAGTNTNWIGKIVKYSVSNGDHKLEYQDLDDTPAAGVNVKSANTGAVTTGKTTNKGVPTFAVDTSGSSSAVANNTIYIVKTGDDKADVVTSKDGDDTIYTLNGVLNGEVGEISIKNSMSIDGTANKTFVNLDDGMLYELERNGNYVSNMIPQDGGEDYEAENVTAAKEVKGSNGTLAGKTFENDTVVYVINGSKVRKGSVSDAKAGDRIYIKVVSKTGTAATAKVAISLSGVTAKAGTDATCSGVTVKTPECTPSSVTIDTGATLASAKVIFTITVPAAPANGGVDTTIVPAITIAKVTE